MTIQGSKFGLFMRAWLVLGIAILIYGLFGDRPTESFCLDNLAEEVAMLAEPIADGYNVAITDGYVSIYDREELLASGSLLTEYPDCQQLLLGRVLEGKGSWRNRDGNNHWFYWLLLGSNREK